MGNGLLSALLAAAVLCVGLPVGFAMGRREENATRRLAVMRARRLAVKIRAALEADDRWLLPEVRAQMQEDASAIADELEGVAA